MREWGTRAHAIILACVMGWIDPAVAQSDASGPASTAIPAPKDIPYPGVIKLAVDASDVNRRIFAVHETLPVRNGEAITLLYPQWLPGQHGPNGRIDKLAGLVIRAGDTRVEWTRDPANVYAFRVDVPAGATVLDIEFQFMSALEGGQSRVLVGSDILDLTWESVILYPAGYYVSRIPVEASMRLPEGWQFGSALETDTTANAVTAFKRVSLETLVDSPVLAGRNLQSVELSASPVPVHLVMAADRPDSLAAKPDQLALHRALVKQAYALFGGHHFGHYDFLLAMTDDLSGIGLEHHQSSEDIVGQGYFTEWEKMPDVRDLLPHEFVHSWNGKFRRPADLWTPDFNTPMQDSLLWVYEGQTYYWGLVLAARAGLITHQQALDSFAGVAAAMDHRSGRVWRNLQDTTNDPIMVRRQPVSSRSWQRGEDYYGEGALIWLDADTLIRELSRGKHSLDDFARTFFGRDDGKTAPQTYTFDDVVAALNAVQPHDWQGFLRARLDGHGPGAPLDGLVRGGYKLVYRDAPNALSKGIQARRKQSEFSYSLGFVISSDGKLSDVQRDSPADKAGLANNAQIFAVNGAAYEHEILNTAVTAAKTSGAPIELIVKTGDRFRIVRLDYRDGLRFPHLERAAAAPAQLDEILSPR